MLIRISIATLMLSISLFASASKLDAHNINSKLSPAIVSSVPGQWTLVQLWTLDCVVCEKQKPALSQLNKDYDGFTVFGLSLDGLSNADSVKARLAEKLLSFDNYLAELDSVKLQLQSSFDSEYTGTPTYILYSPAGKIIAVHPGPIDLQKLPKQLELTKAQASAPALAPDLIQ